MGISATWTLKTGYSLVIRRRMMRGCGGHVTVTVTGSCKTRRVERQNFREGFEGRTRPLPPPPTTSLPRSRHNSTVSFFHRPRCHLSPSFFQSFCSFPSRFSLSPAGPIAPVTTFLPSFFSPSLEPSDCLILGTGKILP